VTETVYIGVGSNQGDKLANCRKAIEMVNCIPGSRVMAQSDFFQTEPVGVEGHDWYVNCAISVATQMRVHRLLRALLEIEAELKRERKKKWDPRTIDLDILLFGQEFIDNMELVVPHPRMHSRKFVLVPMCQLAPDLIHPLLGKTMRELLETLTDEGQSIIPVTVG
jgi:2-amino-4-hydroxy-6-hydroxymethyldihydropteridine diphosphokinase